MIDLYYWTTSNGHKITIFLEETGLAYTLHPVNINVGEQFDPAFVAISPNNRIPAIVDRVPADGGGPLSLMESGAILEYLAEKTHRLLPANLRARWECLQWLYWQMGGLGPMAGQNHHFNQYAPEKIPYAIDRYVREVGRLYAVLDRRLADRAFIAGDYSTSRATRGCSPSGRSRTSARFPILRGGRRRSRHARRSSARTRSRRRSIPGPRSAARSRDRCCSGRARTR
jgi:GST-like protein